MRNRALHDQLRPLAELAREHLAGCLEAGAEIPFEVAESPGAKSVLYHYRPLSDDFVRAHFDELRTLDGFSPALLTLEKLEGASAYLRAIGIGDPPMSERERAEAVLREFLARLWTEVTVFELEDGRFERTYRELESIAYEDTYVATVLAPLLGVRLADERWEIGPGVALARGDLCDAPAEAVWATGREEREPNTLVVFTEEATPQDPPPLAAARLVFRKLLTTLRLFKAGPVVLGSSAWWRVDDGPWQSLPLAFSGRPRAGELWLEPAERAELTELFELVRSRPLEDGSLSWALARFEMGCERSVPVEGLSDHLLALGGLLHDDQPSPVGVSSRLAALCADPPRRESLKRRVEQAFGLQRVLMRGGLDADYLEATGSDPPDAIVLDLEQQLRAILRDVVCGYLDPDVKRLADELLRAEADGAAADARVRRPVADQKPAADEAAEDDPPAPDGSEVVPGAAGGSTPEEERSDDASDEEQATEETVAVGAGEPEEDGWDRDDDPSDYSAAV